MRSFLISVIAALSLCPYSYAAPVVDTSSNELARTFVEALVESHEFEQVSINELAKIPKGADHDQIMMAAIIRNGTRAKLKLSIIIGRLQQIHPTDSNFAGLPTHLANTYSRKVELFDEYIRAAQSMIAGPRPGVDYGKLAGHLPEVTAQIDFVNESIFKITPMVALMLVSKKADSKGHLSHFSITRKEGQQLIARLQSNFGKSLGKDDQNWTTSSASLMRTALRDNGYQFADDPWL